MNEETGTNTCCGGPAPKEADACCVKDAEAKAAGDAGCGCGCGEAPPVPRERERAATCCR